MFEKQYQELTNYLKDLHLALLNSHHPREGIKIILKKCGKFYHADKCSIVLIDTTLGKWKILWTYDRINKRMSNYHSNQNNEVCDMDFWNSALEGQVVLTFNKEMIKSNSKLNERLQNIELVKSCPFGKNPSGFLVVENPRKYIGEENFIIVCSHLLQRLTRELKLIDLAYGIDCTKMLKKQADVLIHIFGRFELITVKGVITSNSINSVKIISLIECLILNKQNKVYELACELWPQSDYEHSVNNLRRLVHRSNQLFSTICEKKLIIHDEFGYGLNKDLKIVTDIDIFKNSAYEYQTSASTQNKIEALMHMYEIYKGSIYGENRFVNIDLAYEHDYIGYMNEFLKSLFKANNYLLTIKYSTEILKIAPYNPETYFWLIKALCRTKKYDVAKAKHTYAKKILLNEDYELLFRLLSESDCHRYMNLIR